MRRVELFEWDDESPMDTPLYDELVEQAEFERTLKPFEPGIILEWEDAGYVTRVAFGDDFVLVPQQLPAADTAFGHTTFELKLEHRNEDALSYYFGGPTSSMAEQVRQAEDSRLRAEYEESFGRAWSDLLDEVANRRAL